MTLGVSGLDLNTARYVQSVQAMDGLSNAAVSSIYNQSVFGGNGFGNYGYSSIPFAGYGYGMNMNQMLDYQQQYTDANLALNKRSRAASQLATANEDSVSRQVASLQRQVQGNKQENIMQEYNKLLETVRQLYEEAGYTDVTETQIKATAERLYAQTTGNALVDDIKAHSDNSFVQGFKNVITFGIASRQNSNENIQKITGENANNATSVAGKVAGGTTAALTLGVVGKCIYKFAKSPVGKSVGKAIKNFILH